MLSKYLMVLLSINLPASSLRQNNVCKSFNGYFSPENNMDCYYDPDTQLETPQLIKKYAGVVETHTVISEDGYMVTLFRIPVKTPKGVVLVHHSIATSSQIYLWQGNHSFAVTLWRNGFDVWLANHRGTSYSNRHINITTSDFNYWNFGAHEMALYDVSAELRHISEKTNNSKIIFIGHSLGSGVGLMYASLQSEEAKNYLHTMILLAPPAYFTYATSIVAVLKPFAAILERLSKFLQIGSPLLFLPYLLPLTRIILRSFPIILLITAVIIWMSCGFTPNRTDPTFFNFNAFIYGNNFSLKTFIHFLQISNTHRRFQMYDYGKSENLKMYGSVIPPLYPLHNISVPILLVSSTGDSLCTKMDSEDLFNELPAQVKIYGHWKLDGLNHLDYLVGLHREVFTKRLIMFLNNINRIR
ncbi:lysosomal acid lipase/cholesteryl ester hydrolase-like [Zophobas morio]|uniref:lysosomal acid lipase/cholesteryl ester hydrolase-like n=1 Tax=Zophobas morio TaxID=2755281 RepID=UPI003083C4E8